MSSSSHWRLGRMLALLVCMGLGSTSLLTASPPIQAPRSEPTKAPYIFPTPIFIPTYPADSVTTPPSISGPGATPLPAAPSARDRTYTVQQGDSPWIISQKVYGSGAKYSLILVANGLSETSILQVGAVLRIPSSDSLAQPAPTLSILSVPTVSLPSPVPLAPTSIAQLAATPTETPTPSKTVASSSDLATALISFVSCLLLIGGVIAGALAVTMYRRSRRLDRVTGMVRRVRTR